VNYAAVAAMSVMSLLNVSEKLTAYV